MQPGMTDKEARWVQALQEVSAVLGEADLPFFLDTGTLLGAVRDKRFIPWDNDIDLGILKTPDIEEKLLQVTTALHGKGYSYFRSDKAAYFTRSPDIEIGFMFYELSDGYYTNEFRRVLYPYGSLSNLMYLLKAMRSGFIVDYNGHSAGKKLRRLLVRLIARRPFRRERQFSRMFDLQIKDIRVPREFFDNLAPLNLYGGTYLAPSPVDRYLETRYGKGWKTPVSNYNYFEDDRSTQG